MTPGADVLPGGEMRITALEVAKPAPPPETPAPYGLTERELVCRDRQRLPCSSEADAAVDAAKLTNHHHLPGRHAKGVRGRQA